jgi:hypothetical protein
MKILWNFVDLNKWHLGSDINYFYKAVKSRQWFSWDISSIQFFFSILNKILAFQMNDSSIIQWILNRRYAKIIIIGNRMVYGNWEVLELLKEYTAQLQITFMAACIVVVALRADSYVHGSVRPGFKSRRKQQRHKRDWSFSDLFDRIFKIFKFSDCILQRLFENKI